MNSVKALGVTDMRQQYCEMSFTIIQSNLVITNSIVGASIVFVCYNREDSCRKVAIWDQKYQQILFVITVIVITEFDCN